MPKLGPTFHLLRDLASSFFLWIVASSCGNFLQHANRLFFLSGLFQSNAEPKLVESVGRFDFHRLSQVKYSLEIIVSEHTMIGHTTKGSRIIWVSLERGYAFRKTRI